MQNIEKHNVNTRKTFAINIAKFVANKYNKNITVATKAKNNTVSAAARNFNFITTSNSR